MSIGGEIRVGRVSAENLGRMVELCGLADMGITAEGCVRLMALYADMIPDKLEAVFDDLAQTSSAESAAELRAHMLKPITDLCKRSKAQL